MAGTCNFRAPDCKAATLPACCAVRNIALAIAFICLACVPTDASQSRTAKLTIVVEQVRNSVGVVGVLIFGSPNGWPEDVGAAIRRKAVPAHAGVTSLDFDDLAHGEYAVVVLHDENENMKLDKNFLGIPKEGWGMSNNPKAHSHAPKFTQAQFTFARNTNLHIQLNY